MTILAAKKRELDQMNADIAKAENEFLQKRSSPIPLLQKRTPFDGGPGAL
jgi:hypothetical protein